MKFNPLIILLSLSLSAVAAEDPFVRDKNAPAPREGVDRRSNLASVTYEAFSLPLDQAAALLRQMPGDEPLYKEVVARAARGEAKLESIQIVRGMSGQKQTTEGLTNYSYPEGVVGGVPRKDLAGRPKEGADAPAPQVPIPSPVAPAEFKILSIGSTLETEPTLAENGSQGELRLAPEHKALVEVRKWGKGASAMDGPVHEVQALNTHVTLTYGKPALMGTISRPPGSKFEANSPRRVWFAFVTLDLAKN